MQGTRERGERPELEVRGKTGVLFALLKNRRTSIAILVSPSPLQRELIEPGARASGRTIASCPRDDLLFTPEVSGI